MAVEFSKWEGTGNDFVVIDDRGSTFPASDLDLIRRLCDRHFGIGSDGLMLLQNPREEGTAFHMEFFNPDGSRSFCGNGSRCAFACWSGITDDRGPLEFSAIDGRHRGAWAAQGQGVRVDMRAPVENERLSEDMDRIHTGSPHLLIWVEDPDAVDLVPAARAHRYAPPYKEQGINVNYLAWRKDHIHMRTYERGVEQETLSCGTGVTAAAISAMQRKITTEATVEVRTRGGVLWVTKDQDGIALTGAVREVYQGRTIDL